MLNNTYLNQLIGSEIESNVTANHWSDEYSNAVRASIFIIEFVEWIFLLISVIGMYLGIEIGHPSNAIPLISSIINATLMNCLLGLYSIHREAE